MGYDRRIDEVGVTRTVAEAELAEYHDLYSDLYKDVHGFRPRNDVSGWTADDFRKELDGLSDRFAEVMAEEAERAQARRLERRLAKAHAREERAMLMPTRGPGWAYHDHE